MTRQTPPIHARLNVLLVAIVLSSALGLLWVGAHLPLVWSLPVGIVFSFVLLSNYALMHEATHDNLHPDPAWNQRLGVLSGFLFPMPFSMLKVTHTVHHCCNRTDYEMFDLYYPGDNMFLKLGQWYGLMCGWFWPCIPVGTVLLATFPALLRTAPFRKARTTAVLFDDFEKHGINRIRREVVLMLAFWTGLFYMLDLRWSSLLIMYACFAFHWSTRQYVTHAFTPRDVINGALNLRSGKFMSAILLHGNWDLVHHQKPWLPWTALEEHGKRSVAPVSFWPQYWRMWRGPVPVTEASPKRLPSTPHARIESRQNAA